MSRTLGGLSSLLGGWLERRMICHEGRLSALLQKRHAEIYLVSVLGHEFGASLLFFFVFFGLGYERLHIIDLWEVLYASCPFVSSFITLDYISSTLF